jgi:NADPH:quinone reductase-like Zn-dependent oxidoreductase
MADDRRGRGSIEMKAIRVHKYGPPEVMVLEDTPDPLAEAGEIVIGIEAAGVNPADYKFRNGSLDAHFPKKMPFVPGMDVAGRVLSLGQGVSRFEVGDRVFGMMPLGGKGGYAERAAGLAEWFAAIPEGMDMATAASLPCPASTAIQQVEDDLDVRAGQRVLVTGATGACGLVACYAAKRRGAQVTAAVRRKYRDRVQHADDILFLDDGSSPAVDPFDAIVDTVGGATAHRLLSLLKPGGALSSIGTDPIADADRSDITVRHFGVKADAARLGQFAREVAAGTIEPVAFETMPLAAAAEAHRRLEAGGAPKIVLV